MKNCIVKLDCYEENGAVRHFGNGCQNTLWVKK